VIAGSLAQHGAHGVGSLSPINDDDDDGHHRHLHSQHLRHADEALRESAACGAVDSDSFFASLRFNGVRGCAHDDLAVGVGASASRGQLFGAQLQQQQRARAGSVGECRAAGGWLGTGMAADGAQIALPPSQGMRQQPAPSAWGTDALAALGSRCAGQAADSVAWRGSGGSVGESDCSSYGSAGLGEGTAGGCNGGGSCDPCGLDGASSDARARYRQLVEMVGVGGSTALGDSVGQTPRLGGAPSCPSSINVITPPRRASPRRYDRLADDT
jgi:hypothetical protein